MESSAKEIKIEVGDLIVLKPKEVYFVESIDGDLLVLNTPSKNTGQLKWYRDTLVMLVEKNIWTLIKRKGAK